MPAVNKDGQPNTCRAAEIHKLIHGCTDRTTSVQNIVDQYDGAVIHIKRYMGALNYRLSQFCAGIVAIEAYIQIPQRDGLAKKPFQYTMYPTCQKFSAGSNAN